MAIRAKRSVRQDRAFIWRSGRRLIAARDFSEQLVAGLLDGFGHAEAVGGQRESVELLEGDAVTQVRAICAVCEGLILLVSRAGSDFFTPQKNERMRAGGRPNGQFPDFHPRLQ